MRKQFVKTVLEVMEKDSRVVLFLGDIGVYGFREAFERFPDRTFNIGILEQASVSVAAGLAIEGLIPIFHSISPFITERCLEQLKVDFGYQHLGGNFISVGASYDYSTLGGTHHCPGDVQALKAIPEFQIVVPGHPEEFDSYFKQFYNSGQPTYFRLSERSNGVGYYDHELVQKGKSGIVIAIGPMLDTVLEACKDLDVAVSYNSFVNPLYNENLLFGYEKIVVVESLYEGTLNYDIQRMVGYRSVQILSIGVPRYFITSYGTPEELDEELGLTARQIRARIREFLNI